MRNARWLGIAGGVLTAVGAVLLWARPGPAGQNMQELGASLFVLGALVALLALLAWDVMNPYDERDAHAGRSREDTPPA